MTDREMLEKLVRAEQRLQMTPVVDDEFPAIKHELFGVVQAAAIHLANPNALPPRPKIVCLCGSTRFWREFQEANYRETMAGHIVLTVGHYPSISKQRLIHDGCMGPQEVEVEVVQSQAHGEMVGCTAEQKVALDQLHFRKIEMADEVLILNVGGYVGQSTANELAHAIRLSKVVRFLEPPGTVIDRTKP